MYKPFYLFIAQRYVSLRAKNHFIGFISLASLLGIALGVAVLITVSSVMNGFSTEIRAKLLEGQAHISLSAATSPAIAADSAIFEQLRQTPSIGKFMPFIMGQAMLSHQGQIQGLMIQGIDYAAADRFLSLSHHIIEGSARLESGAFQILLSREMALELNLNIDDKISLIIPHLTSTLAGVSPRIKRFTLKGIFELNSRFDSTFALIDMHDAGRLFNIRGYSGIQILLPDALKAPSVAQQLNAHSRDYIARDWTQQFDTFFKAIRMEKTVMTLILSLIIAVASFNLVSSLVMMVTEKRNDIAVLRTLGAKPSTIMWIFIIQGSLISILGVMIGVVAGVVLSINATRWYATLSKLFNLHLIDKRNYFIDFLPSELHLQDITIIAAATMILSFLATLYPAWCALKVEPAEALRYD